MKSNYLIEIYIEKNLLLVSKILLFFNKNRMTLTNMKVDEQTDKDMYYIQISLTGIKEMIEKMTRLISKQVGVYKINYQKFILTSSNLAEEVESI